MGAYGLAWHEPGLDLTVTGKQGSLDAGGIFGISLGPHYIEIKRADLTPKCAGWAAADGLIIGKSRGPD